MNLLGAKLYDPGTAVSKATSSLLAMTAIDTTNLRLAITVPAHGMVRFRLMACVHGATTFPTILLGVMNGSTVIGRVAPVQSLGNTAVATAMVNVEADFTVTGLTPGALNADAAYGVETVVASTGLKYGGPNNTTANDAFGAFVFEAWDPQPNPANFSSLSVDGNGRVDVIKVAGTTQTAGDICARLPAALVSGRMDSSVGAMAANVLTASAINASALNGKGDWNIGKTGYALSAAGVQAIWDALTSALTTVGSIGKLLVDNINATISSRSSHTAADVWASATRTLTSFGTLASDVWASATRTLTAISDSSGVTTLLSRLTAGRATNLDNLDAAVSTRLAASGYTAPDNAGIAAIQAKTDNLPVSPAATGDDMNVATINGSVVTGTGQPGDLWRGA